MALYDSNNGSDIVMPVQPMGNYGNGGGMFGMNGDGMFYYMFMFFFFLMFGGWGNGFGNGFGGGSMPYMMNQTTNNDVQRGFDQQSIMGGLTGINNALSAAEVSRCNGVSNIIGAVNNGFTGVQTALSNGQMAQMQNTNTLAMALTNGTSENRLGLAELKYNIANEACADRQAVNDGVRDLAATNTANTNLLLNTINNGIQAITDRLCQQEIEQLKSQNQALTTQLNMATLNASQNAQTGQIISALQEKPPVAAYVVANPNGCACNQYQSPCYRGY